MPDLERLWNKDLNGRGQGKTIRMIYNLIGQVQVGNIKDLVILINVWQDIEYMLPMLFQALDKMGLKWKLDQEIKIIYIKDKRIRFISTSDSDGVRRKLLGTQPLIFDGRDYHDKFLSIETYDFIHHFKNNIWEITKEDWSDRV